ncbi:MAG: shikimate dehydrogenase [Calditerrivibrio sp.]|nr:shikimate dehydrogenase [Calditerrivibrio sp.]
MTMKTFRNFALIGKPLKHSLSPIIHTTFLYKNRINGGYCCFEVEADEISELLDFFRSHSFYGFNVTLPYKETVIKFLDDIDEDAEKIRSVNTVLIKDNRLLGYNTDIKGIQDTFKFYNIDTSTKEILVIGAGGATRGLLYQLKKSGYKHITITSRTLDKAKKLIEEFSIEKCDIKPLNTFDKKKKYDIIINSSSIGITSIEDSDYLRNLRSEFVFDMQYKIDGKTFFLDHTEYEVGVDGLIMLIGQAFEAFKIWNNIEFDIDYNEIINIIGSIK